MFPGRRAPLLGRVGEGWRGDPHQVLRGCPRRAQQRPVDLPIVQLLLVDLVPRRPARGAAESKCGDHSQAHQSPRGRPRGPSRGRPDSLRREAGQRAVAKKHPSVPAYSGPVTTRVRTYVRMNSLPPAPPFPSPQTITRPFPPHIRITYVRTLFHSCGIGPACGGGPSRVGSFFRSFRLRVTEKSPSSYFADELKHFQIVLADLGCAIAKNPQIRDPRPRGKEDPPPQIR